MRHNWIFASILFLGDAAYRGSAHRKAMTGAGYCCHYYSRMEDCEQFNECTYYGNIECCYQTKEAFRCPLDGYNPGYVPSALALGKITEAPPKAVRSKQEYVRPPSRNRQPPMRERKNKVASVEALVELEKSHQTPDEPAYVGLLNGELGSAFYNAYDVYSLQMLPPKKRTAGKQGPSSPKRVKLTASFFRNKKNEDKPDPDLGDHVIAADSIRISAVATLLNGSWQLQAEDVTLVEYEVDKQMTPLKRDSVEASHFAWLVASRVEKEFKEFIGTAVSGTE